MSRAVLPLETYPVSAGIKGGLAGAVVMALLAMTYGIVNHHERLVSDQSPGRGILRAGRSRIPTSRDCARSISVRC